MRTRPYGQARVSTHYLSTYHAVRLSLRPAEYSLLSTYHAVRLSLRFELALLDRLEVGVPSQRVVRDTAHTRQHVQHLGRGSSTQILGSSS